MAEYRIDELAQAAGTTVRNIRTYQDRGLLPSPHRVGRVGIYTEAHLARLRLIGRLLNRGYTVANIAELVSAWEQGRDLSEVLGLEEVVTSFWTEEIPAFATRADVLHTLGGDNDEDGDKELITWAARIGLVQPEGGRYRVPSPRLLHVVSELITAGIPPRAVLDLAEQLVRNVDQVVHRFVTVITDHIFHGHEEGWLPSSEELPALATFIRRLKPLTTTATEAVINRGLEHHLDAALGDYAARILPYISKNADDPGFA